MADPRVNKYEDPRLLPTNSIKPVKKAKGNTQRAFASAKHGTILPDRRPPALGTAKQMHPVKRVAFEVVHVFVYYQRVY